MNTIHIGWPQGIVLALTFVGVGVAIAKFGRPKVDTWDWVDVFLSPAINLGLLYWGGFFG